jgi:hypothetical protein
MAVSPVVSAAAALQAAETRIVDLLLDNLGSQLAPEHCDSIGWSMQQLEELAAGDPVLDTFWHNYEVRHTLLMAPVQATSHVQVCQYLTAMFKL